MKSCRLEKPQTHKAKVLLWADLTFSDMDLVEDARTIEQLQAVLAKLFHLQPSNPRDGILLDLYVYNVLFCRDHHFNKEQTSAFFSIVKLVHEACMETPLGNVSQCFELLRELVLCHSVRRPPFSVDLFDMHQVRLVSEYVVNTYFRHFKLYKYAFTAQVRLDLTLTYTGLQEEPLPRDDSTTELPTEETGKAEDHQGEVTPSETEKQQGADATGQAAASTPLQSSATDEHPATSPKAELQQFIQSQLDVEVAKLRQNMEEKLKLNAEMLNSKLAQLEDNGKQKEKNQKAARKK
ncbi:coiled-coil domain-containing protein 189 isoform X2 [Polypterus senegalus]|uniref:coiled-coil domain-containing protein 189 isoform X2 n=1 Tax=Polypterus senegalus TaxID=55291 RepID=UPI00196603D9|nr:coiled-coil domain-containing protein 189 isoform X2 [Polypterus senegalus]